MTLLCYDDDGGREELRLKARSLNLVRVDREQDGGGGRTNLCSVHSRRNKISPAQLKQLKPEISPRYFGAFLWSFLGPEDIF